MKESWTITTPKRWWRNLWRLLLQKVMITFTLRLTFECPKWWWRSLNQITLRIKRFLEILTGLPQVNWTLKDLLKPWLDCPRRAGWWHVMPLVDRRFDGSVILLKWFWLTERVFVPPNIRCMNFFAVKQIVKCKQWYSSNAKFMFVSKFLKNAFFSRKLFIRQIQHKI